MAWLKYQTRVEAFIRQREIEHVQSERRIPCTHSRSRSSGRSLDIRAKAHRDVDVSTYCAGS